MDPYNYISSVLIHIRTGSDFYHIYQYLLWVYVKCLLYTRNLFADQLQCWRNANASFAASLYAFATHYFSPWCGRDKLAAYPFYTLSLSGAKPQYQISCGYQRITASIQCIDRACIAYALREYYVCKADVIRNQNFVQLKNPGNGKTCVCG